MPYEVSQGRTPRVTPSRVYTFPTLIFLVLLARMYLRLLLEHVRDRTGGQGRQSELKASVNLIDIPRKNITLLNHLLVAFRTWSGT